MQLKAGETGGWCAPHPSVPLPHASRNPRFGTCSRCLLFLLWFPKTASPCETPTPAAMPRQNSQSPITTPGLTTLNLGRGGFVSEVLYLLSLSYMSVWSVCCRNFRRDANGCEELLHVLDTSRARKQGSEGPVRIHASNRRLSNTP